MKIVIEIEKIKYIRSTLSLEDTRPVYHQYTLLVHTHYNVVVDMRHFAE